MAKRLNIPALAADHGLNITVMEVVHLVTAKSFSSLEGYTGTYLVCENVSEVLLRLHTEYISLP